MGKAPAGMMRATALMRSSTLIVSPDATLQCVGRCPGYHVVPKQVTQPALL